MDGQRVTYLQAGCGLLLLFLVATPINSESPPCRVQDCPHFRTIRHYDQLGCTRSDNSTECCPTRFNCSSLLLLDKTKCHYRGKSYDPGTQIQQEIRSLCTPSCVCVEDQEGNGSREASFHCAHVDCPEYFEDEPLPSACYRTYSVDQCCSTGEQCGDSDETRQEVPECIYNGKTFLEGQYMPIAESECISCVCQEGFNGTLGRPWCRKFSCDYTFGHKLSELASCAPVYWIKRTCCPISWHCPSPDDRVVRHSDPPTDDDEQCSFGDHRLKIGDELHTNSIPCIKCKCNVPPMLTCLQIPDSVCAKETK